MKIFLIDLKTPIEKFQIRKNIDEIYIPNNI